MDALSELEAVTGGTVSRETFDRIRAFEATFRRWSARINLVAPSTLPKLWERHVLDSAQLLRLAPGVKQWLDLGSGGGFPGAIVAVLMSEIPQSRVDLVESNGKKAAFLRTTLASLGVPVTVHACRIEECYSSIPTPQVVTARALAPLPRLLQLSEPWIADTARALFHKGRDYRREVAESGDAWRFDLVEHSVLSDGDSVILEIRNLRRAPPSATGN